MYTIKFSSRIQAVHDGFSSFYLLGNLFFLLFCSSDYQAVAASDDKPQHEDAEELS